MLCEYGCGNEALFKLKYGKWCCSSSYNKCPTAKKINSDRVKESYDKWKHSWNNKDKEELRTIFNNMGKKCLETKKKQWASMSWDDASLPEKFRRVLADQNGRCLCGLNIWLGKPLKLHIDHIDGDGQNNSRHNLRYLCPNCHSQTETYCGAKSKKIVPDDELINALKTTPNIRQALLKVGLVPKGRNYDRMNKLKERINE